jgi:hypothetical protein
MNSFPDSVDTSFPYFSHFCSMKNLFRRPWLIGVLLVIVLLVICIFVPIPMYDGVFYYKKELVDFHSEGKVALSYFFGTGLEKVEVMGLKPTRVELKGIGYVLFALIHIGLPSLIALRFYFAKQKQGAGE